MPLAAVLFASAAFAACPTEDSHRYGSWKTKTSATCTRQGHQFRYCQRCDHWEQRYTAKLPHTPGEIVVTKEPTCTKNGTGETACLRCARVQKSTIDRLEHPWGEWTVTREPEGKRKGLRKSVCTMCGREREEGFFWEGTLYEGMAACEEVLRMQEKLRDLGFYKGSIRSGQFGDLTTSAVARFQKSVGMEGSGIADPQTLSMLTIAWEKATGKKDAATLNPEEMETAEQAKTME